MSRRKGATAERAVAAHARVNGFPDARRTLAGDGKQPGDIDGIDGVCVEVKNQARYDIPAWLRQVVDEAAAGELPLLVVKPNGVTDVGLWWAITRLEDMLDLLKEKE